ncbi:MAG: GTPase HflX [Planctomycetota bacterium]
MRHSIRSSTPGNRDKDQRAQRGFREPQRAESDRKPERAVLVSILLPHARIDFRDPLAELRALTEAAGVEVVDQMIQKRSTLSPGYALGRGKAQELAERVTANQADAVVFDNDLAPRQIRGLEEIVACKVIDRSELILDIFALRARTREAQLQVELAQLEYTSPRLRGMWTHLERIAGAGGGTAAGAVGGVGTRGPGERQIEVDRRVVRDRISFLKREIADIDQRKQREVRSRSDQFTVSLVGYTNSGKTTLLNRLTGAGQFAADMLFATLETKTARWSLGEGRSVLLSDTVGFIRDLPHHLVASFRATLEEAIHANLLLHVVDISASSAWQQMESVEEVLKSLGCDGIPRITLLNKVDVADDLALAEMLARNRSDVMPISALTGDGLDGLQAEVLRRFEGDAVHATVWVPHAAGKALSELGQWSEVLDRRYTTEHVELDLKANRAHFAQLLGRFREIRVLDRDDAPRTGSETASSDNEAASLGGHPSSPERGAIDDDRRDS